MESRCFFAFLSVQLHTWCSLPSRLFFSFHRGSFYISWWMPAANSWCLSWSLKCFSHFFFYFSKPSSFGKKKNLECQNLTRKSNFILITVTCLSVINRKFSTENKMADVQFATHSNFQMEYSVSFSIIWPHSLTCSHSSHIIVLVSSPTKMRSTKFIFTPSFPYASGKERHSFQ